jgi:hypothetical protein
MVRAKKLSGICAVIAGSTVHHQPGIAFIFIPERFSPSPRNPVHLASESAVDHHDHVSPMGSIVGPAKIEA